eukprot:CAMPEP_0172328564 /NCGR_PEP_ID=MMETSP1058-20130122/60419_1 /TAXON_ID=83371 /ORGANISM="Detonula confervacea, Strain CCMP 353" /LENGTH=71 /DNA_ID=CAMNT_0013045685 /DNA_START=576 /DNA_END=791 /DNA_ORIENTATION=-
MILAHFEMRRRLALMIHREEFMFEPRKHDDKDDSEDSDSDWPMFPKTLKNLKAILQREDKEDNSSVDEEHF